jgi:aryl-alcohol dehydrogenase-like predicted oxidoreductase
MGGEGGNMNWGPQDGKESVNTILTAVDKGINWLDTALAYGKGHSEEVVGMALKKLKKKVIITTKCGATWDEVTGKSMFKLDKASVRAQCEASLKRMGIDVIDMYLMHWPMPLEYMEEGWQTCADLLKEGKIRYIGVSNFTIERMERLQKICPIACMEPPYSMIERRIENDNTLEYCKKHDMGVVVYSPLQQGILTDALKSIVDGMASNDFRRNNFHFKEPELSLNLKLVGDLAPIAKKYGCSLAQLSIAWVLRKSEVTSAINGARNSSEIDDSTKGGDLDISPADQATIENLLVERQKKVPPPPVGGPLGAGGPPSNSPPR